MIKFYKILKNIQSNELTMLDWYIELCRKIDDTVYSLKGAGKIKCESPKVNPHDVKFRLPDYIMEYIQKNLYPSIKELKIERNEKKDRAYQLFNLNKTHRELNFIKLESKLIRYLRRCFIRLAKYAYRGNVKGFARLSMAMIMKSHALRVRAVYKVIPGFHTKYRIKFILDQTRIFSALLKQENPFYSYKRVWIPKPNGDGMRPLSVAPLYWRMVANTVQVFTVLATLPNIKTERFHGGLPGRGPNTWWKTVLSKRLFKSKYIYEFDLSKYFDSILIKKVGESLVDLKVPSYLIERILSMVKNHRENLTEKERLEEENIVTNKIGRSKYLLEMDDIKVEIPYGIPQGLSFSPLLSVVVANKVLEAIERGTPESLENTLFYIDDGIIFTNMPIDWENILPRKMEFDREIGEIAFYKENYELMSNREIYTRLNPASVLSGLMKGTGSSINEAKSHIVVTTEPRLKLERIRELMLMMSGALALMGERISILIIIGIVIMSYVNQGPITHKRIIHKEAVRFCGVEYNLITDRIRGATRNGSELEFPAHEIEKLTELCFEGYYPSDYIRMRGPELAVTLEVFDPILAKIYNNGDVYVDELRRARSAIYSLPSELLIPMMNEVVSMRKWTKGWENDSFTALLKDETALSLGMEANEYTASTLALHTISMRKQWVYDRRMAKNVVYNKIRNILSNQELGYEIKKKYIRYLIFKS